MKARTMIEARTVMAAWRERRGLLHKARTRKGTNVDVLIRAEEPRLISRINSVFRKASKRAQKSVRAHLSKAKASPSSKVLSDLDPDGIAVSVVGEVSSATKKVYKDGYRNGRSNVGVEVADVDGAGGMLQHADDLAIEYANERGADLVTGISDTTRDGLRTLIENGAGEGLSADELADQIESSFVFSSARAEMIARTELADAHINGNMQGWRDSGQVEEKEWATGAGCCDDCDELDGVVVGIDDAFATSDGDIDAPPLHPNCRCDVLPILSKEQDS